MSQSNLMKVVGRIGGDMVTIEGRLRDSGWALIMPESPQEGTTTPPASSNPLSNMMRWVTGFHDVFRLYGRPERYSWDQMDTKSLFFAYPVSGQRSVSDSGS
jgi:CCR4-NOT transcriptional complex subunit CAF120